MNTVEENNTINVVWDSLRDFEEEGIPAAKKYNGSRADECVFQRSRGGEYGSGYSWVGCKDNETAMRYIRDGWPEMLQKLHTMWGSERPQFDLAQSHAKIRRRKRMHGDYGDSVDMTRVWSGQLDTAWHRPQRVFKLSATQRHATLYINLGSHCGIRAEEALWRSACAMLVCDLLQKAGRSVEIYVGSNQVSPFIAGPRQLNTAIRVKSYTQPLHEERLAAMVTMAFYRTYGFLAIMATKYRAASTLGYPRPISSLPKQLQERVDNGELVVKLDQCLSRKQAEDEFLKVAKGLAKSDLDKQELALEA